DALAEEALPLGDRVNMAFMGTVVTYGRGAGVVVATGMQTQLGRIAELLQEVDQHRTPLQEQLDQVGKLLAGFGVGVALLVLLIGVLRGETVNEMFLTAVSVAVAVVPEGLPAVVTVTLALGAQRMLRQRALIRKLPAVETLGAVTVICSDKTGTLTENRMTVTVIDVAGHYLDLVGTARHPAPALVDNGADLSLLTHQIAPVALTLVGGALCNDASLRPDPETGRYLAVGDPTEGALLVAAKQAGLEPEALNTRLPRVAELPFDSDRKRMTTMHRLPAEPDALPPVLRSLYDDQHAFVAITKGAVDSLLSITSQVWDGEQRMPLDAGWRARIEAANDQMAGQGKRVLGVAVRWLDDVPADPANGLEADAIFVGMIGMIDPPRPEVKSAVETSLGAGIRPIMITGDHPLTARFIATDLGISTNGRVKTGENLDSMSEDELDQVVDVVSIFARVTPEHKLRIVEALQKKGHTVAMTGDGVNDSPALKKADIGIAMGITGTDVSKEASQMVLLDDNFATIVAAVKEGRSIYDNIRRFVKFSVAGNLGKVIVMLFAPLFGIPVALLPLQLLWLNLLTDGLLGLGLGMEPAEADTMERQPRRRDEGFFSGGLRAHIARVGVIVGVVGLVVGVWFHDPANLDDMRWQTMIFSTLAFLQIGQALASRSTHASLFTIGLRSNPALLALAGVTLVSQLAVIYVPFLQRFFQVVPLSPAELVISLALGSLALVGIELEKRLLRPVT
ncbi:MAG: cation-translocating P-type ATPase, partial [Anaerolineae bacterium]|nr:cation-translocating P-type ATPase [Anaerolineae bacterium]